MDLPSGWDWAILGEIAETSLGKMLDKKAATGDHPTPYLRNINVRWGGFDLTDLASMDIRPEELDRVLAQPGDLIACEGGEPGRAAVWPGPGTIALQKALHRIRLTEGMVPQYVALFLRHLAGSRSLEQLCTGTTIKHLPQEKLRLVRIPVPPRAEQERIVAAIDENFAHLNVAESSLTSAKKRVRAFARSGVAELFRSPEWPWTTLGDIAVIKGGVTKDSKNAGDPSFVEVPYLRVANVQRGHLDLGTVSRIRVAPKMAEELRLQPGDVLLNEGGDRDKLGRGWVWEGQIEGCIHQNHVFRARLIADEFDPYFVSMHANSWGQVWFERHGRQTTNLASISLSTLKQLPVPAPPRDEQNAIVVALARLTEAQVRLEQSIELSQRRTAALRRSVLAVAFSGQLVAQNGSDEPASVLLERIRRDRTATPTRRTRKAEAS